MDGRHPVTGLRHGADVHKAGGVVLAQLFHRFVRCRVPPKLTSIDDHYTLMSRRPVSLKNSSRESTLVTVSTVE